MKAALLMFGIAAIMGLCMLTLIGWYLWHFTGEAYDEIVGQWKRAKYGRALQ
jgi:hypothetical protein